MNSKTLFQILLACLLFVSCNRSENNTQKESEAPNAFLVARYSTDNVKYLLKDYVYYTKTPTTSSKGFQVENKFVLWEIDPGSDKLMRESKFENRLELKDIEKLVVDSVSLSMSESKDKINLNYFLNLGDRTKTMTFELLNDGKTWNVN